MTMSLAAITTVGMLTACSSGPTETAGMGHTALWSACKVGIEEELTTEVNRGRLDVDLSKVEYSQPPASAFRDTSTPTTPRVEITGQVTIPTPGGTIPRGYVCDIREHSTGPVAKVTLT